MPSRPERPIEIATIRDFTTDGRGVADIPGKTVFVEAALIGERVRFRRERKQKNFDQASLVEIIDPSPIRNDPPCNYFGTCGGCSLQHILPLAQIELKQNSLFQQLKRIGEVEPEGLLEPISGPDLGYRRRARLGVRYVEKKSRLLIGFREKFKPYVADMESCQTLAPELSELIPLLEILIGKLSISKKIPQIELTSADNRIGLVIRVLEKPSTIDLSMLKDFMKEKDLFIWLQDGGPETIQLLTNKASQSHSQLYYRFPKYDLQLHFGPLDFIQVNSDVNQRMVHQMLKLIDLKPNDRVLDLFCGIGNLSLPLALKAADVVGVELDPGMAARAQGNAESNKISNTEFFAADLYQDDEVDLSKFDWWQNGFDVVVLDPPRSGAKQVLKSIALSKARKILYISCNPGSMSRDAKELVTQHGYRLVKAGAIDMFPQTSHIEAMALFERLL
ncbi:MAG: 23S rRNA (uracil(1939)-C(5))-methyltransferase RlmD [Pseudomonadota bacterium]|nr:23S rRNA (uracil(1939)-C(5))-methyltransferase RlmD [Pseudomonadota bacterium]